MVATLGKVSKSKAEMVDYHHISPLDRIQFIKRGIGAIEAKEIIARLTLPTGETFKALRIPLATINRKAKNHEPLAPGESERVIGLASLLGQVEAMVKELGNPDGFDAEAWLSQWLRETVPALGGQRPIDLIDTMEGQHLVAATLARMQSGAYA